MYARTNRFYNERGPRTSYLRPNEWHISTRIYILILSRGIPVFTLWKQVETVPMCLFILEGLIEEIFSRDAHNFVWQNQIFLFNAIVIQNV